MGQVREEVSKLLLAVKWDRLSWRRTGNGAVMVCVDWRTSRWMEEETDQILIQRESFDGEFWVS